jgi:hypothetical protein
MEPTLELVQVAEVKEDGRWALKLELAVSRVMLLAWSPTAGVLATWEQYTTTAGAIE